MNQDQLAHALKHEVEKMTVAELAELHGDNRQSGAPPNGNGSAGSYEIKKIIEPLIVTMDTIQEQTVDWLWGNRIPAGRLTLIDGDPGTGKSFLSLALAAAVSRGDAVPGGVKPASAAFALLMSVEDGFGDTVKPRLRMLGADMTRIVIPNPKLGLAPTLMNGGAIEQMVREVGPALLVIDPIIAFTGKKDPDKAAQVRELLSPLVEIAERFGVAVLIIRHLNKGNSRALYRGMGSIDFMAACRSAFIIAEDPEEPTRRILAHVKNSLGPKSPSLSFYIDGNGCFRWGPEVAMSAEDILEANQQPRTKERERGRLDAAKKFLQDALEAGPVLCSELRERAEGAGMSWRTVWRAQDDLGTVKKRKLNGAAGGWEWRFDGQPRV